MPDPGDQHSIDHVHEPAPSTASNEPASINEPNETTEEIKTGEPVANGLQPQPENEVTSRQGGGGSELHPAKKRKLDDTPTKSPLPRAKSPPWKKFIAEGPTSFVLEGRRKSSRTNPLPPQLQPGADKKRQTRSALSKSNQTNVAGTKASRKHGAQVPAPSPSSATKNKKGPAPAKGKNVAESEMMPPPKRAYRKRNLQSPSQPRAKRGSIGDDGSSSSPLRRNAESHERRSRRVSRASAASQDDIDSSQLNGDDSPTAPRIKLKIRMRPPRPLPLLHPKQIPRPTQHASFEEWFASHDPFEGEKAEIMNEEDIQKEAELRLRILDAAKPGGILHRDRCSLYEPEPVKEPPPQYGSYEFIVAHAINFQGLLHKERTRHRLAAKKLAHEAAAYVKGKKKTVSQEQLDKEEEKRAMIRYKQVVRDVKALWKNVYTEVHKLRMARYDEEQHELGKQALDEMLDQSKELLNTRRLQSEYPSEDDASDLDDSESGSEQTDDTDVGSDAELTREELEEKYRTILGHSGQPSDDEQESGSEEDEEGIEEEEDADEMDIDSRAKPVVPEDDEDDEDDEEIAHTENVDTPSYDNETPNVHKDTADDHEQKENSTAVPKLTKRAGTEVSQGDANLSPEQLLEKYKNLMSMSIDDVFADAGLDDQEDASISDDDSGSSTESSEEDDEDVEDEESGSGEEDTEEAPSNMLGFYLSQAELQSVENTPAYATPDVMPLPNPRLDVDNRPPSPVSLDKHMHDEPPQPAMLEEAEMVESPAAEDADEEVKRSPEDLEHSSHDLVNAATDSLDTRPVDGQDDTLPDAPDDTVQHSPRPTPESMDDYQYQIRPPSLLRGKLRAYQHDGLDWLASLWQNGTNGILADEMGLGKTIQTIALLAHVAERGEWGPHLVVVPTSVMLNWEMEFKKWCPGFKILTYYGTQEERKNKRRGWYNSYLHQVGNVVITSYQLILQDELAFKKRDWHYLVLDEAHNIKNFQSQRWQALLKFKTHRRLLLTGTPLQNSIQELWSLLYFLMPSGDDGEGGFAGLDNFTQALKRPTNQILEQGRSELDAAAQKAVTQLHTVLRPYLLRRLKADVEKQMPGKYEHVVYCHLSKRQRQLYDGFMGRADTRQTLSSGNYMSIMNCLMSLRKVCNHPDLFETRQITTSFAMRKSVAADFEIKDLLVRKKFLQGIEDETVNLNFLNFQFNSAKPQSRYHIQRAQQLRTDHVFEDLIAVQTKRLRPAPELDGSIESGLSYIAADADRTCLDGLKTHMTYSLQRKAMVKTRKGIQYLNSPLYGSDLLNFLNLDLATRLNPPAPRNRREAADFYLNNSDTLRELVPSLEQRSQDCELLIQKFGCVTPHVVTEDMSELTLSREGVQAVRAAFPLTRDPFHESRIRLSIAFPDKRLLQYDCGKLQRLATLLRQLTSQGHRALIFTQMTKVLDILEEFLNVHGYKYLRLDGSTPIEKRQVYTSQFNQDARIPVFILSSRSGGLGLNLTGADTVIFYDLDWNPAMDKQCQDRAHRIGQTRDVHIYRFVSEYTIETNILRKSNQKRLLDDVIIQKGDFTTDYFNKVTYKDALDEAAALGELDTDASAAMDRVLGNIGGVGKVLAQVEDAEDVQALEMARKEEVQEIQEDEADFNEAETKESLAKKQELEKGDGVESEVRRHVDEWMVEHLDWELRGVPVFVERKVKKKGTKGVLGARRRK